MEEGYITMEEAARRAGYRGVSAIRAAAASGKLQSVTAGKRMRLTRPEWVDDYLASLPAKPEGYPRGKPRQPPEVP